MQTKWIFMIVLLVNLSVTYIALPNSINSDSIVIAQNAEPVSLDPGIFVESESGRISGNIFEGLVRYQDYSTEVEPCLATSWRRSADGKKWVFFLRKGVRFHDGSLFTANAVVFSFLRQIQAKHPYFKNNFAYADFTFKYVKSVKAIDQYTVTFTLDRPYTPFLYNLAMRAAAPIVSPTAVKKWGHGFERNPVGTGPFKFQEWVSNKRVVLVRNEDYWGHSVIIKKLIFRTLPNTTIRFNEFRSGRVDIIDGLNPLDVGKIKLVPKGRMIRRQGLNLAYLAMNMEKVPFDNVEVRKAINHAINKKNLVKLIYQGFAIPAVNPIPPNLWGYNHSIKGYDYNIGKAKRLLKRAGYEKGFETTLWTMPVSRPYMPLPKKVARAIKGNLSAIGIKARIVSYDWATYLSKIANGEHDMCLSGWTGDNGDPDNFMYVLLDKDNTIKPYAKNYSFFKNDALHNLLISAQQISERSKRIHLYKRSQEIIFKEAPWVPLAHVQRISAFQDNVHDIIFHSTEAVRFYKAWKK